MMKRKNTDCFVCLATAKHSGSTSETYQLNVIADENSHALLKNAKLLDKSQVG